MDIFVMGDIHGDLNVFLDKLRMYDIKNCHIIQVGDFGYDLHGDIFKKLPKMDKTQLLEANIIQPNKERYLLKLNILNEILAKRNIILYVIRGNHDIPTYFSDNIEFTLSNVRFLKDYTVLELNDKRILCVGGAVSIDRYKRVEGSSYWKDEIFIYEPEFLSDLHLIDGVITHAAPRLSGISAKLIPAFLKQYAIWDPTLYLDIGAEQNLLDKMLDDLFVSNIIDRWYFGHYHVTFSSTYLKTTFKCLNINEIVMYGK